LKTKTGNLKFFFIACPAGTYVKNTAYIFVDFRIKRAGSSNSRGAAFCLRQKTAKYEYLNPKSETILNNRNSKFKTLSPNPRRVCFGHLKLEI